MDFSGILLAGGKSRRFGPNKIKIMSDDVPLLVLQAVKLGFFTREILISTSRENYTYADSILGDLEKYTSLLKVPPGYKLPEVKIVVDDDAIKKNNGSIGPIAGIYTGLNHIKSACGLVLASDMPFISFNLLKLLTDCLRNASQPDAVIIKNIKGIEALCGIYSKKCIKIIEESITGGIYKISDILNKLDVRWIGPEELKKEKIDKYNFFNINLPEDIEKYKRIREKGVSGYGTDNISSGTVGQWKDDFFRGSGQGAFQEEI
jgi:molybdopterin-guanine dinucleotide biosynthesis protein A